MEEIREFKLRDLIRKLLLRRETETLTSDTLKEGSPIWIEAKVQLLSCRNTIYDILDIAYKIKEKQL